MVDGVGMAKSGAIHKRSHDVIATFLTWQRSCNTFERPQDFGVTLTLVSYCVLFEPQTRLDVCHATDKSADPSLPY